MTAYSSHQPRNAPAVMNACVIAISNSCFSFVSGFAVFATLGYLSNIEDKSISELDFWWVTKEWISNLLESLYTDAFLTSLMMHLKSGVWEFPCSPRYIAGRQTLVSGGASSTLHINTPYLPSLPTGSGSSLWCFSCWGSICVQLYGGLLGVLARCIICDGKCQA